MTITQEWKKRGDAWREEEIGELERELNSKGYVVVDKQWHLAQKAIIAGVTALLTFTGVAVHVAKNYIPRGDHTVQLAKYGPTVDDQRTLVPGHSIECTGADLWDGEYLMVDWVDNEWSGVEVKVYGSSRE